MKIFVFRHGQTTSDVEDRYGGDYDDHLTKKGEEQAEDLAREMKDFGIEVLFVSSRIRAQETARILQEKLGVEMKTVKDFLPTGIPKFEKKSKTFLLTT